MLRKLILSFLLYSTSILLFAQDTQSFSKDNIRFEMPSSWVVQDIPPYYILVSEQAKPELSVLTTFDVEIDSTFSNLDSFCTDYESRLAESEVFLNFYVVTKKTVDFHGMVATEYHCSATLSQLPMEWKSVVFVKDGKTYKLSTAALMGQFRKQKQVTDLIFDTFEID